MTRCVEGTTSHTETSSLTNEQLTRQKLSEMLVEYRMAFARAAQGNEDILRVGELHVEILDAVFP